MAVTNYVTLKNRTSKTLTGQYDGRQHSFPPGYEGKWPEYIALKFKEQNPLMGSEDYYSGWKQYLLAIVEHGDDTDPIEQTDAIERWDRQGIVLPPGTQLVTIKGKGYHPVQDRSAPAPRIADSTGAKMVSVESFEPDGSGIGSDKVAIADAIDLKP